MGLKYKNLKGKTEKKIDLYICGINALSFMLSFFTGLIFYMVSKNIAFGVIEGILIFFPMTEIVIKIVQNVLGKVVKPKLIPQMDLSSGIPKEDTTMVVIPTIVGSTEKVKELSEKLEVFYLANKSENIYFTILGDCTSGSKEKEKIDNEIVNTGKYEVEILNKKYPKDGTQRFNFIYRKRMWNEKEKCYLGWERKRGLLTELNNYLVDKKSGGKRKNTFLANTLEDYKEEKLNIKYIITLDADTNLSLNSGIELIETMAHPLNKPEVDKEKKIVVDGYGLIQPRVGIELALSFQSIFTEIFAGDGGVDSYTNAISDTYQDNFGEGIYTGKGIYDLDVFEEVMQGKIKENTVLSHDLLEGCYLRCGLASNIMLLDGYPSGYNSYMTRAARWIRGDWQIISYLKSKALNKLSKYKILDNLRRSGVEVFEILNLLFLAILKVVFNIKIAPYIIITLLSIAISSVLDIINHIIFRKENIKAQKKFTQKVDGISASIYRGLIYIGTLPSKAFISLVAIIKTIYRMKVSKEHLLEWTTAEEAEKTNKKDLKSMYTFMISNVITGIFGIIISSFIINDLVSKVMILIFSIFWLLMPFIMWYISKPEEEKKSVEKLNEDEREYIIKVAKDTWRYFEEYMNKNNNFLPPDNFQDSRKQKVVQRTSSTNIGLGLLTIISAYDLKFINLEKAITNLENVLDTVQNLDKWNGHLYNWYSISDLKPLKPRYISTVDSGNFVRIYVYSKGIFKRKRTHTV